MVETPVFLWRYMRTWESYSCTKCSRTSSNPCSSFGAANLVSVSASACNRQALLTTSLCHHRREWIVKQFQYISDWEHHTSTGAAIALRACENEEICPAHSRINNHFEHQHFV